MDDGEGDYLNCPFTREEYARFYEALVAAEKAPLHEFDKAKFFEGCLPIEVMASRGVDTLRFGPMKPVGLADPRTGREPYAVVQLRQDNLAGDHFSLVGFQTQMKWGEQARVLKLIPGLEQAEFVRFGMIHRNTYINGPTVLRETWQTRTRDDLFFAGQMSGVEGYVESAASGLIAGRNAAALALGETIRVPPRTTAIGALAYYVSHAESAALSADQHHVRHHPAARRRSPAGARRRRRRRTATRRCRIARWRISTRGLRTGRGRSAPEAARPGGRRRTAMKAHLEEFLDHLRLNENASAHTVRAYESDLSQFLMFLSRHLGTRRSELAATAFDHLAHPRVSRGLAQAGQLARVGGAQAGGDPDVRPLPAARRGDRRRSGGARRHAAARAAPAGPPRRSGDVAAARDAGRSAPLGRRDRAILELFYASGLRLSELVGLDLEDVNLSSRVVRVLGKGGKERIVPFNRSAEAAIRAWLKDREGICAGRRDSGSGLGTRNAGLAIRESGSGAAGGPPIRCS